MVAVELCVGVLKLLQVVLKGGVDGVVEVVVTGVVVVVVVVIVVVVFSVVEVIAAVGRFIIKVVDVVMLLVG